MKRAFTLVELLVVIAIIAVLVAILVPVIGSALRDANRSGCQANLKSIGTAILEHGRENNGAFPRLNAQADLIPIAYIDSSTLADISEHSMNTVFVMIADGRVPTTGFKCPAHTDYTSRIANSKFGWTQNDEYSYGLQYLNNAAQDADATGTGAVNPADPADSTYNANLIVMADKNPSTVAHDAATGEADPDNTDTLNIMVDGTTDHSNHKGEGLSYLTKSGNIAFLDDTDGSVVDGDEIYLSDDPTGELIPGDADDVVIVSDPT